MATKTARDAYNPSWTEVIIGVLLSLLLGAVLAATFLVLKPVATVKEMPKEPDADVVYYIEGTRDSTRAREAAAKQKTFLQGGAVTLNEDELNQLVAPKVSATKPVQPGAEPAAEQMMTAGAPNFRIRDGVLQIGVPVRVSVAGFDRHVIVQARGGFVKRGEGFVFDPDDLYVGSCPVHRLPIVEGMVMKKFAAGAELPDDVKQAWSTVTDVKVEGSTLQVTL